MACAGCCFRPAVGLAVLAIVAAGVGGYLIADDNGGGGRRDHRRGGAGQPGSAALSPSVTHSSMLDLHGLHAADGRQVYQVWVAQGAGLRPSSNFIPDSSATRDDRASTATSTDGTKVMVTREPAPGRDDADAAGPAQRDGSIEQPWADHAGPRSTPGEAWRPSTQTRQTCYRHPGPGDGRLLLELRPPDLPGLHDLDLGRDALPGVRPADDQGAGRRRAPSAPPRGRCRRRSR